MPLFKADDQIGNNRYSVVRKIGEGQFAEVYEVRDREKNGAPVRSFSYRAHLVSTALTVSRRSLL